MNVPTTYNLSIDDISPQITYLPFVLAATSSSPNLTAGWFTLFNQTGFDPIPGQLGLGESLHITAQDNASFSIPFTGTAIELYGLAVRSGFTVSLDGVMSTTYPSSVLSTVNSVDPGASILASFSNLPQTDHLLTLTVRATSDYNEVNGYILFDRAVVSVSTNFSDATVITKATEDTDLDLIGSWTFSTDSVVVTNGNHTYHTTQIAGDRAEYTFQGDAVQFIGLVNATGGFYNVSLTDSSGDQITQEHLSAFSSFLATATLFYISALDPNEPYKLILTNVEDKTLSVESIIVTSLNGGKPITSPTSTNTPSRLSSGTIAVISVASTIGLTLFCLAVVFSIRFSRRRRQEIRNEPKRRSHDINHVINIRPNATVRPDDRFIADFGFAESESGHGLKKRPGDDTFSPFPLASPLAHTISPLTSFSRSRRRDRRQTHSNSASDIVAFSQLVIPTLNSKEKAIGNNDTNLPDLTYSLSPFTRHAFAENSPVLITRPATDTNSKEGFLSFLDFASSAAPSIRAVSIRSRSTRTNSHSNPSNAPDQQSQKHSSSGRVSLSLSIDAGSGLPNSSLNAAPLSPYHPYTFSGTRAEIGPGSPTDSVPMTVSDLTFRVEQDVHGSEEDKRTSGSHLPPHPPLPRSLISTPNTAIYSSHDIPSSVDHARQPHIAQMLIGRRLAQAQARARTSDEGENGEVSAVRSQPPANSGSIRAKGLQFLHFGKRS